jgi:riboflavin synthase
MFTGLVQDRGRVEAISELERGFALRIVPSRIDVDGLLHGESVAVDGCCLTVIEARNGGFLVEVSPETLDKTSLGDLEVGASVNLERALALGDRLGGHMVLGHVDGVGRVASRASAGDFEEVWFEVPAQLLRWLVPKGSVTVDGVSLTVNELGTDRFSVMLIPETLRATGLGSKIVGARVNLEGDVVGKYVDRLLTPYLEKLEQR